MSNGDRYERPDEKNYVQTLVRAFVLTEISTYNLSKSGFQFYRSNDNVTTGLEQSILCGRTAVLDGYFITRKPFSTGTMFYVYS